MLPQYASIASLALFVGALDYDVKERLFIPRSLCSGAPTGRFAKNTTPRVNPGLCFHAPSGRRSRAVLEAGNNHP